MHWVEVNVAAFAAIINVSSPPGDLDRYLRLDRGSNPLSVTETGEIAKLPRSHRLVASDKSTRGKWSELIGTGHGVALDEREREN